MRKEARQNFSSKKLSWAIGALFFGQLLAICNAVSGIFNQIINEQSKVPTPACQTALNYIFLCFTYGLYHLRKRGFSVLISAAGAKCFVSAVIDVEAWYWIYKSYHYTSLTSVQCLDCLGIPVAILISKFLLHKSYNSYQYGAVSLSLLGVLLIVYSDYEGKDASNAAGDAMCAVGALLFGAGTVCQEWIIEELGIYHYMGTVCWYAGLLSALKVVLLEGGDLVTIFSRQPNVVLWMAGLVVSQFIFYSAMPIMLNKYGCGAANINILAADLYAAIAGVQLFSLSYDYIYLAGMAVTCTGILIYTLKGEGDEPVEKLPHVVGPSSATYFMCAGSTSRDSVKRQQ